MRVKGGTERCVVAGFALLVCVLACAPVARAQQFPEASAQLNADGRWVNGVTESWWMDEGITKADASGGAALWKEIGDELTQAGAADWAGDYFRGSETHGTYMRWSPRGFVIVNVDKCRAMVMGLVYGRVEATPTRLHFFPELERRAASRHGSHGSSRTAQAPRDLIRFVPVRWRRAQLLIDEEEMKGFGDYVAGLGEYNDASMYLMLLGYDPFFLRSRAAGTREVTRMPVVPPGYEHFIRNPIEARVTTVGQRVLRRDETNTPASSVSEAHTYVTINAGTEQGVKDGMLFRVARPDEGDLVKVVHAKPRTSTAVVVRDVDERGAETYFDRESREKRHSRVAAGWRLTTSLF